MYAYEDAGNKSKIQKTIDKKLPTIAYNVCWSYLLHDSSSFILRILSNIKPVASLTELSFTPKTVEASINLLQCKWWQNFIK